MSPVRHCGAFLVLALLVMGVFSAASMAAQTRPSGQIAYVLMDYSLGFDDARDEVWVMNADGTGTHRISGYVGRVDDLQWSADGARLAFVAQKPDHPPSLWLMAADGGGRRGVALELPAASGIVDPVESINGLAWSPDGTRLAISYLARASEGYPFASWILTVDPDSGELDTLTGPIEDAAHQALTWAPDGSEIVSSMASTTGESAWLNRFDAMSGADLGMVGTQGYFQFWIEPAFSPDGDWLACSFTDSAAVVTGGGSSVYRIALQSADGSAQRVVAESTRDFMRSPSWSPDGRWLVAARGLDDPIRVVIFAAEEGGRQIDTGAKGWHPVWRPVLPPPAPTLRIADSDFVEGEKLVVSGQAKSDERGPIDKVAVYVGKQRWAVPVDGSGHFSARLAPIPGDFNVTAVSVRDGMEGKRSPEQLVRIRSKSAALFGFDEGWLGVLHSSGAVKDWVAPLQSKGWSATAMQNAGSDAAARFMQGKGLVVFYGHGLYVRAPGTKAALPGFALAFGDSYLATTKKVVDYASSGPSSKWETMDRMDLSALQVAVYLGCGTGENARNDNSLLKYTTQSGADVAVGFTREVHALFESTPWLNAFRDYALKDGNDVRTAAFRAEQDCAVFGPMVVVGQRSPVKSVRIDKAPPTVEAASSDGGW